MTRRPRGPWLAPLLMTLAIALPTLPAGAAEPTDEVAAAARLGTATDAMRGDANAIGVSATLLELLSEAIATIDDGPWVPASQPHALPINLIPTLPVANTTKARAYTDGCHAKIKTRKATGCAYGDVDSDLTVLLMGDSHGAMWLPAFEEIAARRGWKIHLLTKPSCPPPRISIIRKSEVYANCDAWRTSAFRVIKRLKPDIAVVTSTADYRLAGIKGKYTKQYLTAWREAWTDTMRAIGRSTGQVVVLNDVPKWTEDAVECLTRHADDVRVCATERDVAVRPDMTKALRQAAKDAGATFVDPSLLVCPVDPCPVVDGRYLVTYDTSHITPVYARHLSERLEALLPIAADEPRSDDGPGSGQP